MSIVHAPRRKAFRDYRQRFDADAEFVWRKRVCWGDDPERPYTTVGGRVDKRALRAGQLRRLWKAHLIELEGWKRAASRGAGPAEGGSEGRGAAQGGASAASTRE